MALFKILKGNEANLPSTKHEGWAYVTEKGNMYVDLSNDKRVKIGNRADTAEYADKATGDTQTIRSRYLARIKQVTSDGTQFTFRGETGDGTNAPDLISIPLAGDKAGLVSNAAQTIKGEKTFANGIKFPDVTSTTYPAVSAGLTWSGSTDGAKIYYEVQASDKGMLIIEARDDTNAGAIFRNSNSKKEVSIINGLVTGEFKGNLSGTASHATSDANGKNIASYVASVLAQSDNRTIRVTKGDGTTNDVKLYFAASSSFGGAADSANVLNINNTENIGVGRMQFFQKSGDATLMPDTNWWSLVRLQHGGYASTGYWTEMAYAFHSDTIKFRRNQNGTKSAWKTIAFTDGTIAKATQAEKDWLGQVIDETYMKYPLSISGEVITMTRGDGVSSTVTVPDTKVTQSETTTANYRPIILGYTNTTDTTKLSASTRNQVYASNKFYAQPSTGLLVATTFKGALDGNAKTATNAEFADKATGDTTTIRSTYVKSVTKKSGSNYVFTVTKGDGTANDVSLYFAASSSCGGPANSANLLNTLGSKGSNSTTTGTYTKFATVNVSSGAWVNNSIFMFVSDAEANNFSGLIRIHFRSGSTIASTSISMYWLTISNRSYAGDMYAVKVSDGVYDLYWYNRSNYMSLNFSVIRGGSANISFVSNTTVSSITVAAQSSIGGQVNYANSAGSATNDSAGANIRSTYIATIKQVTSNGTTFTFRGYAGDGSEKNNLITIPAASTSIAGLITNAAQTLQGDKTLKGKLLVETTGTSATTKSSTLRLSSSESGSGGAVGMEFWRGANASWQIVNDSGKLYFRNNYTSSAQTTYSRNSLILNYNTGAGLIPYLGINGENLDYRLNVTGSSYFDGTIEVQGIATHHANIQLDAVARMRRNGRSANWNQANTYAMITMDTVSGWSPFLAQKTANGWWTIGHYNTTNYYDHLLFGFLSDVDVSGVANAQNHLDYTVRLLPTIYASASGTTTNRAFVTAPYASNKAVVGTATKPVYVNDTGVVTACTYELKATLNAGSANRLPYYSSATAISQTSHFANTTQIGINTTNTTNISSYNLYVEGTTKFNGNTTHNGVVYFANATTYYINNAGTANLNLICAQDFMSDNVRIVDNWMGWYATARDSGSTRYGYIQNDLSSGGVMRFVREQNGYFTFNKYVAPSAQRGADLGSSALQWNNIYGRATALRHIDASMTDTDHILYIGYGSMTHTLATQIYYSSSTSARTKFFEVNSNGSYALTRFGVNGQNTSYNFYVNGTSYHTNYVQTTSYFKSTVATGTSPVQVTSTTLNTNLNADLLDSWHKQDILGTYYVTSGTASLSHYWCRIWSATITGQQYNDTGITIYVQSQYNSKYGMFTWRLRQNGANSSGAYNFTTALQEHFGNITSTDIRLYYNNSTGLCEVWVNCWGQYGVWNYSVLKKCYRTAQDSTAIGTFYNTNFSTAQTLPTSSYITASYTPFLGNAATATALTTSAGSTGQPVYFASGKPVAIDWHIGNSGVGEHNANNVTYNFCGYYTSNGPATSLGASTSDGALYAQAYNSTWVGQIAQDYRNGGLYVRGKNNGTWQAWYRVLDSRNYTAVLDGRYVNVTGDTMTGNLTINGGYGLITANTVKYGVNALQYFNVSTSVTSGAATAAVNPTNDWYHHIRMNHANSGGYYVDLAWCFHSFNAYMRRVTNGTDNGWKRIWIEGNSVTSAVWNDYAECRKSDSQEPGYVMFEKGDDSLSKTIERLQHFAGIVSDTWGFSQGETADAKTNIAVAGRVLAYPYRDRNEYKPGDCVCAAPGGKVDIMTREEVAQYPDRIVGTVSCVPEYEEWGGGEGADRDPVKVNGRIWIKVK